MQSINRFLYGPTPEERVQAWQAKLRTEGRMLDREMRQVRPPPLSLGRAHTQPVFSFRPFSHVSE